MDVVVAPLAESHSTWLLNDRLGRALGKIHQLPGGEFLILPSPKSPLVKLESVRYASLDAAMLGIEREMKGPCQLSESAEKSEAWGPRKR